MRLPEINEPRGFCATLPLVPPLLETQTTCVFPLRADLHALQRFIDGYLNFIPAALGRFRACLPYVQLMVVDYERLCPVRTNLGWFRQREIMFAVAVEWYRVEAGRWTFKDWAWASPCLWVDSEIGFLLGRLQHGWPKDIGHFDGSPVMTWMREPGEEASTLTVRARVLPRVYAGASEELRPLLDVRRRATPRSALGPLAALANAAGHAISFARDSVGLMAGLGLAPIHPGSAPENHYRMAHQAALMVDPARPNVHFNSLNLKQFRDAARPREACYQALTCGEMRITRLHGGGMLGDVGLLSGDPSGGYSVHLHRWPGLPIIELFGLSVERQRESGGARIAELRPVLPFWYAVDMEYSSSVNVAVRAADGRWHDGEGRIRETDRAERSVIDRSHRAPLGTHGHGMAGPFRFPSSTLLVLPLRALRAKLEAFIGEHLDAIVGEAATEAVGTRFDLWGPADPEEPYAHVYLVFTEYGPVQSMTDDVGHWASTGLGMFVPVLWRELEGETWRLRDVGLVPVFAYFDTANAVISKGEILGIPASLGTFERPAVGAVGASSEGWEPLVHVSAEMLPALHVGAQVERRTVVEIDRVPSRSKSAPRRGARGVSKHAKALVRRLLEDRLPSSVLTLKQFRDAREEERACYQSVVRVPRTIVRVDEIRAMEEQLRVRIHDYPRRTIVESLGVVAEPSSEQDGGTAYECAPTRPFEVRLAWEEGAGQNLWERSGCVRWTRGANANTCFDEEVLVPRGANVAPIGPEQLCEALLALGPTIARGRGKP